MRYVLTIAFLFALLPVDIFAQRIFATLEGRDASGDQRVATEIRRDCPSCRVVPLDGQPELAVMVTFAERSGYGGTISAPDGRTLFVLPAGSFEKLWRDVGAVVALNWSIWSGGSRATTPAPITIAPLSSTPAVRPPIEPRTEPAPPPMSSPRAPQEERRAFPRVETSVGYSFLRLGISDGGNLHGWNASLATNPTRFFGIVADFSGHYAGEEILGFKVMSNAHTILAGPRFSARTSSVTPFAHALVGIQRFSAGRAGISLSEWNLAMGFGGGIDFMVGRSIGIRAFQLDYMPIRSGGEFVHSARASVGIVVKIH